MCGNSAVDTATPTGVAGTLSCATRSTAVAQVRFEAQVHLFKSLREELEIVGDVGQRYGLRQPACRGAELRRSLTEDAGGAGLHQGTG